MNDTQHENHVHDKDGNPAGGTSKGIGYKITWQNGPAPIQEDGSQPDRNGAFLIEVLEACASRLKFYQESKFSCGENARAAKYLGTAIRYLESRRDRRKEASTLGTHAV